jgi:transposase
MHEPSSPPVPRSYEPLIGVSDLADWLDVSPHTVKKWVSRGPESGLVPRMIRVNGVTKFRPEDVRTWIASKAVGA